MRYSLDQDLLTVSPFGPSFSPQPRVCFRNQPLLPSSAPRSANISPILSTLRILPVATGLPTMVGLYPCSLSLCLCLPRPGRGGKSNLSPLCFQLLAHSFSLFALFSALPPFVFNSLRTLFAKHPGWHTPSGPRPLHRGAKMPLCKSFACHSYALRVA